MKELFVKTLSGRIITLCYTKEQLKSICLGQLKEKLRSEGLAVKEQRLIYDGNQLEDGRKLCEYGIRAGSTIYVISKIEDFITLYIKYEADKTFTLCYAEAQFLSMTVEQLREDIKNIEEISADQQRLVFAGKRLVGGRRLIDYDIGTESTLYLVKRLRGGGGGHPGFSDGP